MFQRQIISELVKWRQNQLHKPLILRGARQVGKTTVANSLGASFENYLCFNMEKSQDRKIFEMDLPVNQLVNMLFAAKGVPKVPGDTLIFIDEIQNSPKTIALLRYFYEEVPDIFVIAAGSLLENIVDVKVSFPVGRVDYLALRPCSFYEFMGAMGRSNLMELMSDNPNNSVPFHTELMNFFQQYMLVGGMPEIVNTFSNSRDLFSLDNYYESLITSYKDDVEKYVKGKQLTDVVRHILSYGWAYSGETITLSNFANSSYRSREVSDAFMLLAKAMLVELCYPTASPIMPIIPQTNRRPKLLWFDTGLVNYQAGLRKSIIGADDVIDVWKGHIAEQVVAQELLALNNKVGEKRAFWSRLNNGAEVDFIYQHDDNIYPIEVKNGINSHLRSLHAFMDISPVDIAVRVWSGSYSENMVSTASGKKFKLINLPLYMVWLLPKIL